MRCEHDTATAELPGVPELPAKPPRTTQAERMARMGYNGPKVRPSCQHCHHCEVIVQRPDQFDEFELRRCKQGDFPVLKGGICGEWSAA